MNENEIEVTQEKQTNGFLATKEVGLKSLPSKGLPYPSNLKISVRCYNFGEVKKSSSSSMTTKEFFDFILSGVVTEADGFSPYDLTINDATYLGLMRKLNSISTTEYKIPFRNPFTKKQDFKVFTEKDIDVTDLESPTGKLPLKVKFSDGIERSFMPLTVKQFLWLEQKGYINRETKHIDLVSLMAKMSSHDEPIKFKANYDFFNSLSDPDDQEVLDDVAEILNHGLKPLKAEVINGSERRVVSIELEWGQALILPFRKDGKSLRDRIYS